MKKPNQKTISSWIFGIFFLLATIFLFKTEQTGLALTAIVFSVVLFIGGFVELKKD